MRFFRDSVPIPINPDPDRDPELLKLGIRDFGIGIANFRDRDRSGSGSRSGYPDPVPIVSNPSLKLGASTIRFQNSEFYRLDGSLVRPFRLLITYVQYICIK